MFESFKYNLRHNRKSAMKAVVAWVLFGLIILVFVFFGMTPQQMSPEAGTVAIVNKSAISLAELGQMRERLAQDPRFQQFQAMGGDIGNQILEQQALNQLIDRELVKQATNDERMWTTDAEVRQSIMEIPAFNEGGRFKNEIYRNYLMGSNQSASEFEGEIRQERALRRTVEMFRTALQPLNIETERQKQLADMKTNVEFVAIPTEALVVPESIKQAEVQAFLADAANEKKVKDAYDSRIKEFTSEETVKVRHILISTAAGNEDAAKKKAEDVAKRVKGGENFAKLAKENSEDPGSKDKGGDLGFVAKGVMVPEFEKAAFELPLNEVSEPIKSQFGFHIIQVQEKKPAGTKPFDEVREDLAADLMAKDRSKSEMAKLEEAMKANDAATINQFIATHKLKWEETGTFSIDADSVPKLGANDEVVKTAFALNAANPMSNRLVRQGSNAFLVKHKAVVAEKKTNPATPGADSPELLAAFTANRRSEDALRSWMNQLKKKATITTTEKYARGAGALDAQ